MCISCQVNMRPGFFKQGKETIMKGRFNSSIYSSIHHLSIYNIHSFINVSKKLTDSMKVLRSLCVCKCSGPSVCVCVCVCVSVWVEFKWKYDSAASTWSPDYPASLCQLLSFDFEMLCKHCPLLCFNFLWIIIFKIE